MIKEFFIKKLLDEAYGFLKKELNEREIKNEFSKLDLENSIIQHLKFVQNWSQNISFKDFSQSINIEEVFVELDMYLTPRKCTINEIDGFFENYEEDCIDDYNENHFFEERASLLSKDRIDTIPFSNLLESFPGNIVVLGHPGAGKTTTAKRLCQSLLSEDSNFLNRINFPILVRIKDLNNSFNSINLESKKSSLYLKICEILGIKICYKKDMEEKEENQIYGNIVQVVNAYLDSLNVIIVLDGFDEFDSTQSNYLLIEEIESLCLSLSNSSVYLTSRTGNFDFCLENANTFELCPLSLTQIDLFINKWLGQGDDANNFRSQILKTPYIDSAARPLTLAHLCAIFKKFKKIPDKPKSIYKKITSLLIEEWDVQRGIERSSRFMQFEPDRKFEFLCKLAYLLKINNGTGSFDSNSLKLAYSELVDEFDLPKKEMDKVVSEIEQHNGLFVQSGFETFEFSHLSIQEYLAAEYLVKLPTIPDDYNVVSNFPNEYAISVALSSNPSRYMCDLLIEFNNTFKKDEFKNFLKIFIYRITIEKPDFKGSPFFSYICIYLEENGYKYYVDILLKLYEKIFEKSLRLLKEYYYLIQDVNGQEVLELRRDEAVDGYHLPKKIFYKEWIDDYVVI